MPNFTFLFRLRPRTSIRITPTRKPTRPSQPLRPSQHNPPTWPTTRQLKRRFRSQRPRRPPTHIRWPTPITRRWKNLTNETIKHGFIRTRKSHSRKVRHSIQTAAIRTPGRRTQTQVRRDFPTQKRGEPQLIRRPPLRTWFEREVEGWTRPFWKREGIFTC